MQINRVDVFANNKDSTSFPERHTDYCGGCAFVDIDAGEDADGGDVFTADMKQSLSCNDGLATLERRGRSRASARRGDERCDRPRSDRRAGDAGADSRATCGCFGRRW